jgi:hypothetical protein
MKHTKEPWSYHQPAVDGIMQSHYLITAPGKVLYVARVQSDTMNLTIAEANAERITSCINACASIPNPSALPDAIEALKQLSVDSDRRVRTTARAALKALGVE